MEKKINNQMQVSEQTANFIKCYKEASVLFGMVADATEVIYTSQCDHFLEPFAEAWQKMYEELEKLTMQSIYENVSQLNNDYNII